MKKKRVVAIALWLLVLSAAFAGGWWYLHSKSFQAILSEKKQDEREKKQQQLQALEGSWIYESGHWDMEIWQDEDGLLYAAIHHEEDDGTTSIWQCSGKFSEGENGFLYYDGKKEHISYDMDGNANMETLYENGNGKIYLKDRQIFWEDEEEEAGEGLSFAFEGEY
ncbi:MAG: hypothetical protein IJ679_07600 [Lachnospiraceae bacterium]|nr:hypothetical protein [Lachnospiraceae bacterium]